MVKNQSFAQILVDHLSYPVMSSLLLLMCWFVAFDYSMSNRFIIIFFPVQFFTPA